MSVTTSDEPDQISFLSPIVDENGTSVTTLDEPELHSFLSTLVGKDGRSVATLNESDQVSFLSTLAFGENGRSVTTLNRTDRASFISTLVRVNDYPEEKTSLPQPPSDIPDGGLQAYLQVLGAHFLILNSW